jgi:MFS-type transporter involved in bile tolerance (Atg22 family)
MVGWIAAATDSARTGILSILLLFAVGAILLARVDVARGQEQAGRG